MKYRLKKELLIAKQGTVLETQLVRGYTGQSELARTKVYVQGETFSNERELIFIGFADRLIAEGWVEEVKPREWTLLKANNGEIINASEGFDQFNFKGSLAGIAERIKVREVIE